MRLVSACRLLSLRSDVDDIILELLGRFSLDRVYADSHKDAYQQLVITLLVQLNTIFYIQRLSLPSEHQAATPQLGFLVTWEVALRTIEFVLNIIADGRDTLWEARATCNEHLSTLLLSVFRILTLHPKVPANLKAKGRRDRFTHVIRSLECVCDRYPGSNPCLLLVCKDITNALLSQPDALAPPYRMKYELPTLATKLYPLPDCLSPHSVSGLIPEDGSYRDWLTQFLALRDVSQFIIGAFVQYAANRESRDFGLQAASARSRDAVLHALSRMQVPPHIPREQLVATFKPIFEVVLRDSSDLVQCDSADQWDDEIDAIDALCLRLTDRQIIHRVSDHEVMRSISEVTRSFAALGDPNGQFRSASPSLYVVNCRLCHFAGYSSPQGLANFKLPRDTFEIPLPRQSKCNHCGEIVTMMREIPLIKQTWERLRPLESNADTIIVQRHSTTQFQLVPQKLERSMLSTTSHGSTGTSRSGFSTLSTQRSSFSKGLDTPRTRSSPENTISYNRTPPVPTQRLNDCQRSLNDAIEPNVSRSALAVPVESTTSSLLSSPSIMEKSKSKWRPKLPVLRKDSRKSGDAVSLSSSVLSSSVLEGQKLEEIQLKSLANAAKAVAKGRSAKNINVCLSLNSHHALFWNQVSLHIWDVGTSPSTLKQTISTEFACVLAAMTNIYLAYVVGNRDQKLTLRIKNLLDPSLPVVEHRMASSPWCRSIAICPTENYVVLGFENATVRFFDTTNSQRPREDRLHRGEHAECIDCPSVDTLSFSNDGLGLLASIRNSKNGTIQIYQWRFPFLEFQELWPCRYRVPLHESEDNGVTSALLRSNHRGGEGLVCITTWTQSGVPMLFQPNGGQKTEIRSDASNHQKRLGTRIQCAAFSPSGTKLALVNDKGHLYQVSNLMSTPLEIQKISDSKGFTGKSDSYAMSFVKLPDDDVILLAWADSQKGTGFIKKVPITSAGDINFPPNPNIPEETIVSPNQVDRTDNNKGPVELFAWDGPAIKESLRI